MPEFMIRNVPVHFPFEPYDVQRAYMEKVIDCLQSGAHGMLESPTGTGKTLSLLCSTLAWLTIKKAQIQATRLTKNDSEIFDELNEALGSASGSGPVNQTMSWGRTGPKIIYASRTHSQLSQAVSELKRTNYAHMRMAVIGSRDQLCTHKEVSKEENTSVKMSMCQTLLASRSCHLHRNIERKKDSPEFVEAGVMDIEDLIKVCDKLKVCPYFMSRELKQSADIIFMPYNYLLDPRTRRQQDVDISNSVIILDEGHNVEKICEDSASYSLTSTDVAMCISEITAVMKMYADSTGTNDFNEGEKKDFSDNELMMIKEMLLQLEKVIDSIALTGKDKSEVAFPGEYIFELLEKASITHETYGTYTLIIEQIVQYLNTLASKGPFQRTGGYLEKFASFVRVVFHFERVTLEDHIRAVRDCYKVFVTLEKPKFTKKRDTWLSSADSESKAGGKIVNFWCFNPAHGMKGLLNLGVHSIIVTSGTLSPLPPLISELGIPINITLENGHVIGKDQVYVSVVREGPDGVALNSTFKNRSNDSYLTSLGRTIVNFSRLIPEGLLVFFPSYSVLNQCKEHWEKTGIWNQIFSIKEIFVEPQGKRELKEVMDSYYARILQPGSKGACFFAVCRGKVSEGLDFSDQNGRAVILTGLPYPPFFDPRVIMKREYLDRNKKKVTGQNWYQLEATRAVNQAVGRVIRHRHDYGAVLFCDNRFAESQTRQQMSAWLRPYIQTPTQFGAVTRGLGQFFRGVKEKLPQPHKKAMAWDESSIEAPISRAISASFDTSSKLHSNSSKPGSSKGNFNWNAQNGMSSSSPLGNLKGNSSNALSPISSSITSSYSQWQATPKPVIKSSKGIFGALDESVEIIDFNSVSSGYSSASDTLQGFSNESTIEPQEENGCCPPEAKRKKIRVMGVPLSYEEGKPTIVPGNDAKQERQQMMVTYIKRVKGLLSKENLTTFNSAVRMYSKESNLSQLMQTLDRLFNEPRLFSCLTGFDAFIKAGHKAEYAEFCKRKTGAPL